MYFLAVTRFVCYHSNKDVLAFVVTKFLFHCIYNVNFYHATNTEYGA